MWYNTFLHVFLCPTTYQKLVFYAGIPLTFQGSFAINSIFNLPYISAKRPLTTKMLHSSSSRSIQT